MKLLEKKSSTKWFALGEIQILLVFVLAALFFYFAGLAIKTFREADRVGKPDVFRDTVSITGQGKAKVTPDVALVNAGLEITAPTVADAQKQNTEKMNGFLQKMKELGVQDADCKTIDYSVTPKYEYHTDTKTNIGTQVLVGYTVSQTVQLKVRDLSSVSAVLSNIGDFGLNQIGSFQFTVDDDKTAKAQALDAAIADAQSKADRMEQASHITLGKVVSLYEGSDSYPAPLGGGVGGADYKSLNVQAAPAPTSEPGTHEVTSDVTLTYEVK